MENLLSKNFFIYLYSYYQIPNPGHPASQTPHFPVTAFPKVSTSYEHHGPWLDPTDVHSL
jgi:hypothetical protein